MSEFHTVFAAAELAAWLEDRLAALQTDARRKGRAVPARLPPSTRLFDVPSGLTRIRSRPGGGGHWWKDNSQPQDSDNDDVGDYNIPVVYVGGSTLRLSAKFSLAGVETIGQTLQVNGEATWGTETYRFTGTASVFGTLAVLSPISADRPLPLRVDAMDPFSIRWTFRQADGRPITCGPVVTKHRIYVTLGPPDPPTPYETIVHLSCTNARGQNTAAGVVGAVWNEFTDRIVRRKPKDGFNRIDNVQMTYYANWDCVNLTTAQLLQAGDGQCGAWASLFLDMLRAHAINFPNEYVIFYQSDGSGWQDGTHGFAVKNWSFAAGAGLSGDANYPYLNLRPVIIGPPFQYLWPFAQVNDQAGIPGQGTVNPASLFNNHQVVKLGTTYYDPSYGVTYPSFAAIENNAIDGYWWSKDLHPVNEFDVGLDLNGNGTTTDPLIPTPVILFKKNLIGNQLKEETHDY